MRVHLRQNIADLEGYIPGEQPQDDGFIKLNTNENPYPPSPQVLAALRKAANTSLRLYPDPSGSELRSLAAAVYGVRPGNVMAGNGSDELLSVIMRCYVGVGDRVAYPVPTYSLYDTLIHIQEGTKVLIPYPEDFSLPPELFSQAPRKITILCNPNAPSGTLEPLEAIERLASSVPGMLIVDEAYIDFADRCETAIPLIDRFPNLIVLRSFSKSFSLAGMRIGLAFACEEIIEAMMKVKDSYNLCRLSLVSAIAALQDLSWMRRNVRRIQHSRKVLSQGLGRLGFLVYPSQANFVMARSDSGVEWLYRELKKKQILVRFFDSPELQNIMRVTVGKPREVQTLLREMKSLLQHSRAAGGTRLPQSRRRLHAAGSLLPTEE